MNRRLTLREHRLYPVLRSSRRTTITKFAGSRTTVDPLMTRAYCGIGVYVSFSIACGVGVNYLGTLLATTLFG